MRKLLIGAVLSVAFSGAAMASDYIVVNSSDPAIKRGQSFDAGARVALGAGQSVTLMRASGEVTTLRGSAGGVAVPGARLAAADAARFETLRALVQPPPTGRTFGARRGGWTRARSVSKRAASAAARRAPGTATPPADPRSVVTSPDARIRVTDCPAPRAMRAPASKDWPRLMAGSLELTTI